MPLTHRARGSQCWRRCFCLEDRRSIHGWRCVDHASPIDVLFFLFTNGRKRSQEKHSFRQGDNKIHDPRTAALDPLLSFFMIPSPRHPRAAPLHAPLFLAPSARSAHHSRCVTLCYAVSLFVCPRVFVLLVGCLFVRSWFCCCFDLLFCFCVATLAHRASAACKADRGQRLTSQPWRRR